MSRDASAPAGPDGVALVDKPMACTSHDVVGRARRIYGTRRVGHAGTLDPNATGLLVLGVGRGTRLLTFLTGLDKTYETTIELGARTVTDDAWGEVLEVADPARLRAVDADAVRRVVAESLTGDIDQVPSAVSAIKVHGERSYRLVRRGQPAQLAARRVRVDAFDVVAVHRRDDGRLDVDAVVSCSAGTYVRALARDLGARLGVGGHVSALRRTRIGPFRVADAAVLPASGGEAPSLLTLGRAAAAVLPVRVLTAAECGELRFGRSIPALDPATGGRPTAALSASGELVAVVADRDGRARPRFVVPAESSAT